MSEKTQSQLSVRLREARERLGVSVAQAAADTRILQRYILALEEGEFSHLPGDVYARGFIRNYAQYLGLPPEEMVECYRAERGSTGPIRVMPAATPPRTRSCAAPSVFVVFFLVAILAVGAYLVANAMGLTRTPMVGSGATVTAAVATPPPVPTSPSGATVAPLLPGSTPQPNQPTTAPGSTPIVGVGPSPTPASSSPLVVEVRVVDSRSWLRIVVDGRQVLQGERPPGWSERFEAEREVSVRAGNAGGVELAVNGGAPERLGRLGQVVTRLITPQLTTP